MKRFLLLSIAVIAIFGSVAQAAESDAAAALALALADNSKKKDPVPDAAAKALADTLKAKPKRSQPCFESIEKAQAEASKTGKRLVLWVGMLCESKPEVRSVLDDCVHCHCDTFEGDSSPRVLVEITRGHNYRLEGQYLTPSMAKQALEYKAESKAVQSTPTAGDVCPTGNCPTGNCPTARYSRMPKS